MPEHRRPRIPVERKDPFGRHDLRRIRPRSTGDRRPRRGVCQGIQCGRCQGRRGDLCRGCLGRRRIWHADRGPHRHCAQLAASFAGSPGSTIEIKVESLRFLGSDTALEEGRTTIIPAKSGESPEITRFTVVYIKKNGQWLQSAVRDETAHDLSPHDRLKELEWLVGEWINESQGAVVNTSCKWSDDGNFLIREFTMKTQGEPVLSGRQRIGWDAVKRQFKTWVFDSQGGFGDGYWTRDGDRWLIKAEGVRQDGKPASATNIITRIGKDRIGWQSVDRVLGGAAVPGIDEFTLVRKPPEPGK